MNNDFKAAGRQPSIPPVPGNQQPGAARPLAGAAVGMAPGADGEGLVDQAAPATALAQAATAGAAVARGAYRVLVANPVRLMTSIAEFVHHNEVAALVIVGGAAAGVDATRFVIQPHDSYHSRPAQPQINRQGNPSFGSTGNPNSLASCVVDGSYVVVMPCVGAAGTLAALTAYDALVGLCRGRDDQPPAAP